MFYTTGSTLESAANEFFLGFSTNFNTAQNLQLFVTTAESSSVNFIVEAAGFSSTGVAVRDSSAVINIPTSLEVGSTSERNKGIHVKAEGDKTINVYGLSYSAQTSDAFLALPCNRLAQDSYEYFAASVPVNDQSLSGVLVVACENNTEISIGSESVTLNRLQTYLSQSSSDITGTRITSTKPITLYGNHECATVPSGTNYCDHLTEQIPPTTTWGRSFLVASFLGRNTEDVFRVVASESSTSFTINCTSSQPVTHALNDAGSWQQFTIARDSFCSITATKPVLVMQYALGSTVDEALNGNVRKGDPLMMMLPPVEQYGNNYVINILTSRFSENYITIYVDPEYYQPDLIFVDSANLASSQWTQVYCSSSTCGYITRMQLTTSGDHQVRHQDENARLGVSVYGQNQDNSYGYPAGLRLTPVQCKLL